MLFFVESDKRRNNVLLSFNCCENTELPLQSLLTKCNYRYVIAAYPAHIRILTNAFCLQKAELFNIRVDGS